MKILGKCPYCTDGKIESRKTVLNGKKGTIYACSNAHWKYNEIEETFALSSKSTCSFRIFSNSLLKYNKFSLGDKEIRTLLSKGELEVTLHARNPYYEKLDNGKSKKKHKEYTKFIIPHKEYGIEVLWED